MDTLIATPPAAPPLLDINKGVVLTTPVIGRIMLGHTVQRGDMALPVRDDHFTLTTLYQDKQTRVWEQHPLQESLPKADDKLRAIPVRIAYDNVNLNLHNRYTVFHLQTGRVLCTGNGIRARRLTEDGIKEIDCPRPAACEYGQRQRCKNFSRAYFRIEGQADELGAFILRTTSYNSLDRLGSRLNQLAGLTGGRIANMPMQLILETKTTTQSFREPIYFADLVTRPGMTLIEAVEDARKYRKVMDDAGLSIEGMEEALRAGLANSDFTDEIEDVEEWVSDEDLIAAVQGQRNTGLQGMDSLVERLNQIAAQRPGTGDDQAPIEDQSETSASGEVADEHQPGLLPT